MLRQLILGCAFSLSVTLLMVALPANTMAQLPVVVTGPDEGQTAEVKVFNSFNGDSIFCVFSPYPRGFTGGVRVATGDVNGDGVPDIVTAPGASMAPRVRIFDGNTCRPLRGPERDFFAYRANFRGGVYVATGDVNGDGQADIVTGAGAGGRPVVRAFDGRTGERLISFLAYDESFRGGVHVAAGDVDGDGLADIVTGAGPGGGPHVKIFSPVGPTLLRTFLAYPSTFLGGVFVGVRDLNHDGFAEIITGPGAGGMPQVKVFDAHNNLMLMRSFLAFGPMFSGEVHVALGDFNGDGAVDGADFIVGAGPGGGPHVKIFNARNEAVVGNFFAYPNLAGGVFVAGFHR